jgi:protein phosphatase
MIRTDHSSFPVAAISHPGMTGKNNEDRYAVSAYRLSRRSRVPVLFAVLSDGIGGHRAGEVAAQIAVDRITQVISASALTQPSADLEAAVIQANQDIYAASQEDAGRNGMGATCAAALTVGRRLFTVTVGDSRIYLMRGGAIRQVSIDHTWIQEALDSNLIRPEEVAGHPNAHVIRRYLGAATPPKVDHRIRLSNRETDEESEANQGMLLRPGDRLLLCSDGLTDLVSEAEILAAFEQAAPEAAIQSLTDLANERGGHDNITLLTFQSPPAAPRTAPSRASILPSWRYIGIGCLATLLAAALIAALVIGYSYVSEQGAAEPATATRILLAETRLPEGTATAEATATLEPLPTGTTAATPALPDVLVNGDTLTPWPTHTLAPPATQTPTQTAAATLAP